MGNVFEMHSIEGDEDFTDEEQAEIDAIHEDAGFRSKLVHQARQIIKMDAELTATQLQGVMDRKRIRELEKQLEDQMRHSEFMGLQQVKLCASADPEKLKKNFSHTGKDGQ